MKKMFFLLVGFHLVLAASSKTEDCSSTGRRRIHRSLRRYQPRTGFCWQCQPHHRNLLVVGLRFKSPKLQKCFSTSHTNGSERLSFVLPEPFPEAFILVIPDHDFEPEPETLTTMADALGNVSVLFAGNFSSAKGKLYKQCRALGEQVCFHLKDLNPVLNEVKEAGRKGEKEGTWNEFGFNRRERETEAETVEKTISLRRQLDKLINELCKREKSRNILVEIKKEEKNSLLEKEKGDGEDIRVGLSLKDLLPPESKFYDKNRPPKLGAQPTVVYFHVTVLSLDSINEESMTYVADIFLAQSWRDPRLRLPESMSDQYRILDVDWLHDIWRPDCFFKNAKQVTFHEITIPNHYVWLYHDKTILYMSKLTLVLSCAMKFESYPHDIQVCSMMIESLSHTVQDLIFLWNITDPLVVNPEIELPQLDISKNYTSDCTVQYSTGNFTCLAVVFNLKRRLGYHLLHTYIPSALIVVMSWISFWIKPEAIPARVTLGVTSLLTLATQNTQSQQSLPPVSYVKAIDIWMSSCSVFVFLSLMEFALVNNYMGPVAGAGGYSEEDLRTVEDGYRVRAGVQDPLARSPRYPTCYGKEAALCIDRHSPRLLYISEIFDHKEFNGGK